MRYNQLTESTGKSVRDLNLPPDLWKSGTVSLNGKTLDSLDGCPDEIPYDFYIWSNKLTSLAGGPKTVGGDFACWKNNLTSLVGAPKMINGHFNCSNNQLTSLAGCPKTVGLNFYCTNNHLTSLAHSPTTIPGGEFSCNNNQLVSLQHAPRIVSGGFMCSNNQLTSLVHAPETIGGGFDCTGNHLTSLADIHTHVRQMNGKLKIGGNPITSHILGILLIQGCYGVVCNDNGGKEAKLLKQAVDILNKYLKKGRAGIMDCQAAMIAADLGDFAQI